MASHTGASNSAFNLPAFRADNNLLGIGEDISDVQPPQAARQLLLADKELIVRDFQLSNNKADMLTTDAESMATAAVVDDEAVSIDMLLVTRRPQLARLVAVYAALLDLQLCVNVLNEISYLLNLLNAIYVKQPPSMTTVTSVGKNDTPTSGTDIGQLLGNAHNCVWFGLGVLATQQHVLLVLDLATMRILLQNERLLKFADAAFAERLQRVHARRQRLHDAVAATARPTMTASGQTEAPLNVSYQQDIDTRHNFPTAKEFGAFNKQRDQFYAILRLWQASHFVPSWSCAAELGPKVLALLRMETHPVNMHHLAKLYVSQLLLSCTFDVCTLHFWNLSLFLCILHSLD